MEKLDRQVSERVLRATAEAGVDLEQLAATLGLSEPTLTKRLTKGPWKLAELGKIAAICERPLRDLMPEEKAA